MAEINKPSTGIIEIQQFPLWKKLRAKKVPLSFEMEITARCNMSCKHCYINLPATDEKARAAELTTSEILDIARQAVELGAIWCLLTGGEPLLRRDFKDIYLGLKRLGLLVSVFTNATMITEQQLELFRKYPPRDIEVTVYGVDRKIYEKVTGQSGSFEHFITGLDRLAAVGLPVRLKAMAIKSNLHQQKEIAQFCRSRTKDYFRFDPQLHLRFDGDPVRNEEIRQERLTPEQVIFLESTDKKRSEMMLEKCDKLINEQFTHLNCDHLFHCSAGCSSFNVSYDGRFRLCSSLWADGTTYDLRKGSLASAWTDFAPKVRDLRSQSLEYLESCHKCALVNLCLWCPAHAHLETGKLDGATPYFCSVAKKRAEMIKDMSSV